MWGRGVRCKAANYSPGGGMCVSAALFPAGEQSRGSEDSDPIAFLQGDGAGDAAF